MIGLLILAAIFLLCKDNAMKWPRPPRPLREAIERNKR